MSFLMDYLSAIQFVAALNIGYIIPDILRKMYDVLENINVSYMNILRDVKNKTIVKQQEICAIPVVETKDDHSTQPMIDDLKNKLDEIGKGCDENEKAVKQTIGSFIECSGYRSLFFYSALYSVFTLILIPFCHQHESVWAFKCFFYLLTSVSIIYMVILFFKILIKKSDVSCRKVLGFFIVFVIIALLTSVINGFLPAIIFIGPLAESILSWMSIFVSFIPCVGCILFLAVLILYSICLAKRYKRKANTQFAQINKTVAKLDDFNKLLNGNITLA